MAKNSLVTFCLTFIVHACLLTDVQGLTVSEVKPFHLVPCNVDMEVIETSTISTISGVRGFGVT